MKNNYLFPNNYREYGVILFLIGLIFFILNQVLAVSISAWQTEQWRLRQIDFNILTNDAILLTLIAGLLLIAFTKEKIEDEQIAQLRSDCLQWSLYLNYVILIICVIFFNGGMFFSVMIYNIFTPLLFFIIRFRWKIYLLNRLLKHEEKLV